MESAQVETAQLKHGQKNRQNSRQGQNQQISSHSNQQKPRPPRHRRKKSLPEQIEEYRFARPPLPSDFNYLPMSQERSNSKPPSEQSDTLNRLEVETTSTTSVPISFPYYYIDEHNNSLDTFNLLANSSSNPDGPLYKNTSHLQNQNPEYKSLNPDNYPEGANTPELGTGSKSSPKSAESANKIKESISNDVFNQVPQRFSQFISDQQQFSSKRPEELASNTNTNESSMDTDSDRPLARSHKKSRSTMNSRRKKSTSFHGKSSNSIYDHNRSKRSSRLSRQISNSMESQATIFSTRPDEVSSKNSRIKNSSSNSSLRRSRAIKSKEGGIFYRMKLRLRKWIAKFKKLKFSRIVPSKRTSSIKRSNTRSRTLKRKYRANPKNPTVQRLMNISAPVNNPQLGNTGAMRVATLDDQLKYQAGAPQENVNVQEEPQRMDHLSEFIDQQQGLYLNDIDKKANSINYGKEKSPKQYKDDEINSSNIEDIEEVPLSEYSSIPPPPPKHQYQESNDSVAEYGQLMELWRRYLSHVVAKRIQLRQEIIMFQSMVVGQEMKSRKLSIGSAFNEIYDIREDPNAEDYGYLNGYESENQDNSSESEVSDTGTITSSNYSQSRDGSTSGYETITSGSKSNTVTSGSESADNVQEYLPDPDDERFNRKYQNRQSVLSEMLDYESSDSESTIESMSEHNSVQRNQSLQESNLELGKHYSIKHKNVTRSFSSVSSPNNQLTSPLRRSDGYHNALNQV